MIITAVAEMEQPVEMGKLANDMGNSPDSWEMADLEARMEKLMNLSEDSRSHVVDAAVPETVAVSPVDQVDSVLREAVQNPRFRMTILRLEYEVERFLHNPNLQHLEFQPIRSSYLRLAAHRVAQHYFLQSAVVDNNCAEGGRIVARKTSESNTRSPAIRLADIPVEATSEDKPSSLLKVAIKQRPDKASRCGQNGAQSDMGMQTNPSKSMEERKEDYNRARARIFSGDDLAGRVEEEEAVDIDFLQVKDLLAAQSLNQGMHNDPEVSEAIRVSTEPYGVRVQKKPERDLLNKVKMNNKVAIFRDHEKDRRDPDYDRNREKYVQHFDPGFGVAASPFGFQGFYAPLVNYNSEFRQLVNQPRQQLHMEQPPPCSLPQQMPWVPASMGYRPDSYIGRFGQAHNPPRAATAMYMHSPLVYHAPTIAYTFSHDQYQQSLSQLPFQSPSQQLLQQQQLKHRQIHQQPEASISQARGL